ncbi:hypothetical protein B5S33_g2396 [[Candida] boidinii]|nr:hypothetical protein B5S30_g1642 [[Candida] boidinii]OWB83763.1 hypothetical protein B5S33_g2396 [[Candida] boidinii]GMF59107.1 unnamed protein product [[Candida] boidinii]
MAIPPPHYDVVLLREHLYQDLKKRFIVLPPNVDDPGFKPANKIGLGSFGYQFSPQSASQASDIINDHPLTTWFKTFYESYTDELSWKNYLYHSLVFSLTVVFIYFSVVVTVKLFQYLFGRKSIALKKSDSISSLEKGDFYETEANMYNDKEKEHFLGAPLYYPKNLVNNQSQSDLHSDTSSMFGSRSVSASSTSSSVSSSPYSDRMSSTHTSPDILASDVFENAILKNSSEHHSSLVLDALLNSKKSGFLNSNDSPLEYSTPTTSSSNKTLTA